MATANTKWLNLGIAYLALVAAFIPYVGWSPALTTITEDLGLSYSQAGNISAITGLVAGLTILIGGILIRRWGSKPIVALGLLAAVLGQAVFAMADTYAVVMGARLISGLAVGLLFVGTYTLAIEWFHGERLTKRALGIMLTGDGLGSLFTLFFLAMVMTAVGWRSGLLIQGAVLLAVLIAVLIFAKDVPTERTRGSWRKSAAVYPRESGPASALRVLKTRNVALAITFWFGGVGLFTLISSWMPAVLVEGADWTESSAGFVASTFALGGMAGAFASSYLADLMGRKRQVFLSGVLTSLSVAGITVALISGNYVLVAVLIPLAGVGVFSGESTFLTNAAESVRTAESGIVTGLVLGLPWIVSGYGYPYILGAIKDLTGSYSGGFVALTVITFLLCVTPSLFLKEQDDVAEGELAEEVAV